MGFLVSDGRLDFGVEFGEASTCTFVVPAWVDPLFAADSEGKDKGKRAGAAAQRAQAQAQAQASDICCTPLHSDAAVVRFASDTDHVAAREARKRLLSTYLLRQNFFFSNPLRGATRLLVRACFGCEIRGFACVCVWVMI